MLNAIKSWSTTQRPISLSSGEAEFYGVVKASSVALGYQAMMEDLGQKMEVRVWTDSTATMGICGRRGLGKLRHIDTQCLWIQQKVRNKAFEVRKIQGELNPADLFTTHLPGEEKVKSLVKLLECELRGGRAAGAPKLRDAEPGPTPQLLAVQQAEVSIEHENRTFLAVEYEGGLSQRPSCMTTTTFHTYTLTSTSSSRGPWRRQRRRRART